MALPYTLTLHALSSGHLTLPSHLFITPTSLTARETVPSLSFLIQHTCHASGKLTRIVFDLGLRRDLSRYAPPIQKHTEGRRPISTTPDVVASLAKGGLRAEDVDFVIYSHVHWDHIGEPLDFRRSTFVVGHGSRALLAGPSKGHLGSHSFFEADLLPEGRTMELDDPEAKATATLDSKGAAATGTPSFSRPWLPHPVHPTLVPQSLDLFGDGSVYIVNAPGHLQGHVNLLVSPSPPLSAPDRASTSPAPPQQVYLAGDAVHSPHLLNGTKQIGTWTNDAGRECCIHVDKEKAAETIGKIGSLRDEGVEIVFAHDKAWEEENGGRFFGAG
ncbi:hypothetical protein SVAN01_02967 [Stagonosporopsis vannaccii]|nr:hypothetical protein SVAN01_02967 [Stagonosporopsis vannaccii]